MLILRLNGEHSMLERQRDMILDRLDASTASQRYLESVVEVADEFQEIREVVARYTTLVSTHQVSHELCTLELISG